LKTIVIIIIVVIIIIIRNGNRANSRGNLSFEAQYKSETKHKELVVEPGVVAHAFNPSTREAEAGEFLSSRAAWSTK
jgi:major histocompatibility complex class I